jgi:hypothetical protein
MLCLKPLQKVPVDEELNGLFPSRRSGPTRRQFLLAQAAAIQAGEGEQASSDWCDFADRPRPRRVS